MAEHPGDLEADLALALELVDAADAQTLPRFRAADLDVMTKADRSPVTDADTAAETAVRRLLASRRPDDAVLGEEEGLLGGGPRVWVVDPIDGTKSYLRGVPVWATLVALLVDDEPVLGVVSAPALGTRWWAARGGGTWTRGPADVADRRCAVSRVDDLAEASVSGASLSGWVSRGALDQVLGLMREVWRVRGLGDFWSHCLVAEGAVDVAAEPRVNLWDLAALQVLVEEAGGRFTDLTGVRGAAGGDVLTTNGLLHDTVLARLHRDGRGPRPPRPR